MLTTKQAAEIIGVHPNTISYWRRIGKVEAMEWHYGGKLSNLYSEEVIEQFAIEFKEQRKKPCRGPKTLFEQSVRGWSYV